jgi:hypothetical protein
MFNDYTINLIDYRPKVNIYFVTSRRVASQVTIDIAEDTLYDRSTPRWGIEIIGAYGNV